jgi:hypothetical protein
MRKKKTLTLKPEGFTEEEIRGYFSYLGRLGAAFPSCRISHQQLLGFHACDNA